MSFEIIPCNSQLERKQFVIFPWQVYKGDQYWVPPLISERMAFWDKKKNPFYEHSDAQMFVAKRDGKVVGTIAAILNNRHNEFHQEKTGFWGGFECINDPIVANALFDTARAWVKMHGMDTLRGPANVSMNDEVGLLVDGFDGIPQVLMTYNPRYYVDLVNGYRSNDGNQFKKAMDLWAWWNPIDTISDKIGRVAEIAMKRAKFTVRQAKLKNLEQELAILKKVYASYDGAWKDNWGHVPATESELEHVVKGLKQFADEEFIHIAEKDGQAIGVSVALPNVNLALHKAYPQPNEPELFTLAKFLYYRRVVNSLRWMLLGVLPEHRSSGVDAALIYETMKAAKRKNYVGGELSWILETNDAMNKINKLGGGYVYRTYRMYDLAIT